MENFYTVVVLTALQNLKWSVSNNQMFFSKSSLLLVILIVAVQTASFNNINLSSNDPSWASTMNPKSYMSGRDAVCLSSDRLTSGIKVLPMFSLAEKFLNTQGMAPYSLMMFCQAAPQNYYLFLYATSSGIVRINLFFEKGFGKVTAARIMDTDLYIRG